MAVIGRVPAVANIFGLPLSGLLAWLVWLSFTLFHRGIPKRVMFLSNGNSVRDLQRGARLITGDAAAPPREP